MTSGGSSNFQPGTLQASKYISVGNLTINIDKFYYYKCKKQDAWCFHRTYNKKTHEVTFNIERT